MKNESKTNVLKCQGFFYYGRMRQALLKMAFEGKLSMASVPGTHDRNEFCTTKRKAASDDRSASSKMNLW
jgi:hypothetical protein